jgi:hypothetical protein
MHSTVLLASVTRGPGLHFPRPILRLRVSLVSLSERCSRSPGRLLLADEESEGTALDAANRPRPERSQLGVASACLSARSNSVVEDTGLTYPAYRSGSNLSLMQRLRSFGNRSAAVCIGV